MLIYIIKKGYLLFHFAGNGNKIMGKRFELFQNGVCAPVIVEAEAYEGVKRIAQKSAEDICQVTGVMPEIVTDIQKKKSNMVLYATVENSKLLLQLCIQGKLDIHKMQGKREVYGIEIVEKPWEGTDQLLVVYGSEKRGTIYGIFALSEQIGVSPLIFWGDARPAHKDEIILDERAEIISKEPSVRYRGFFINDEWPCFGNWTFSHYDGFTAAMYDKVFELLLRLKGNYLWPAMWSASFALDGPGEENAKLADLYGVIMGNSHHEPCLRASEEWDFYRGPDTPYGTQWNYIANKEGLLKYWGDGLKRSSQYENIITMGMRGERDSVMEGTKTLKDNIDVLKDIITEQTKLIETYGDKNMPRLLAIYKEVERYYYGDENTEGLRSWEGLNDMILLFCEDNYGNMRTLPDKKFVHKGGYGMYYHFDYHGSPVSYEWVNSTPLTKVWEQMTECYEYGVRDVWMVNVGDLKGNEFPLSYFMTLAYDFETWGSSNPESATQFTKQWISLQFHERISKEQSARLQEVLTEGIWLTNLRKPESLHSYIYHPVHFSESERILEKTKHILVQLESLKSTLAKDCQDAFYSMIYYPLCSAMNLMQMHLYAGLNEHYARQGKKTANVYGELVTEAIRRDKELAEEFAAKFDGKWKGMELAKHIGFRKWNEDGCRYPLRMQVEPFDRPRLTVSRKDEEMVHVKNYGNEEQIVIRDFMYPGTAWVDIEAANDGTGSFTCKVEAEQCSWLSFDWMEKDIEEQAVLRVSCISDKLPEEEECVTVRLTDGDTAVKLLIYGQKKDTSTLAPMTFYEKDGIVAMAAGHFAEMENGKTGQWLELTGYGKTGYGLKAIPVTEQFSRGEGPSVLYQVMVEQEGSYQLEVWSAPSNPLTEGGRLCFGLKVNQGEVMQVPSVPEGYIGGEPEDEYWSEGVLNQIHKTPVTVSLHKGINKIQIFAADAGFVLEELLLYREDVKLPESYLGPVESWYSK